MNRLNRLKFLALALSSVGAMNVWGAGCGTPTANNIGGNNLAPYLAMTGTIGTNIKGSYWVLGNGAVNFGACLVDTSANSIIQDFGGDKTFTGNWANACNNGCPAAVDTNVFQIERDINVGTTGHTGQFATSKVAHSAFGWSSDDVNNGTAGAGCTTSNCVTALAAIPVLAVSTDPGCGSTYNHTTGAGNVCVSFPQPNVTGFSGPGAGAAAVVTGYAVYQQNGLTAPATGLRSGWGAALAQATGITCAAGTCSGIVTLAPAIPSTQFGYLALSLTFENGGQTQYVSANSAKIGGPTGTSGLPSRVEVFNTTTNGRLPGVQVRWTTTNESTIAGFNILASTTQGGAYRQINAAQIAAVGNPNTYLQTISNRTFITALGHGGTVYLKLVTVLRDGTTREVGPVSFALTGADREPPAGKGGRQR